MAFQLARGETILYPMPYVEAERPPYVVTNQRLIERSEVGERVLPVKSLVAANRAKSRPYAAWGAFLLCLAVAVAGTGAYFYFSVFGMEAAPYKALLPKSDSSEEADPDTDDPKPPVAKTEPPPPLPDDLPDDPSIEKDHPVDDAWRLQILKTRLLGMGLLGLGAAIGMIGLKIFRKKRFFVVCRTREGMMRILVAGKVQQDIILATLQAVK
jgi:hypothetical protein